jgi:hypothetical protein
MSRKKSTLADLLAQCDPSAPYAGEVWPEAPPVGREFGAPLKIDEAVIERGIADSDAGRGKPAEEVFDRLEAKYQAMANSKA